MRRREFCSAALSASLLPAFSQGIALSSAADGPRSGATAGSQAAPAARPLALGLLIKPGRAGIEGSLGRVKRLGFTNCFLSLDDYLGKFTPALAQEFRDALSKNDLTATTAEVVGPGPLVWDFLQGPATIGIVPRATRGARMDALKQTSDFARLLGIQQIQTHCGFIPEDPADPLYPETVTAIRELAKYCAGNGQDFLMETGQETPTTMSRAIRDVNQPNLGVGLDTANLILYGKANPVDAVDILGTHVKSIHAKDGRWPTDPSKLGEEVLIGKGLVNFRQVFAKLKQQGYSGVVTIERETSGPQQMEDVKQEKVYLEAVLAEV